MKVEVDLTEYGVKAPKWYDPINPRVINASGGSGGSNDVELTLAEYEALSEEEKMNGTNYFITDIGNPKSLSSKVLFSNSVSANTDYTLSDSYKNYDFIKIDFGFENVNNIYNSIILPKERFLDVNTFLTQFDFSHSSSQAIRDYYYAACQLKFLNDNSFKTESSDVSYIGGWSANYLTITGYRYERVIVPNQMVNYSTVEARIGTWVDGKPLYQKSFYFEDPLSVSATDIDLNLQNINKVVGYTGFFDEGRNEYIPLPYASRSDGINFFTGVWFSITQNHSVLFSYRVGSAMTSYFLNVYITIQYTKTTD